MKATLFSLLIGAACFACSGGGSGGSTGGTGGHGTTSGGSTGGSGGDGGTTYCDGMELANGSGADVFLLMYPLSFDVHRSCAQLVSADGGFPANGTSFTQVGGIWDAYAFASSQPFNGLYPGGCDDVGVGSGPSGGTFTAPDAGTTVQSAYQAALATPDGGFSIYGVITFMAGWTAANGGSFYLQDPASGTPPPQSGVDVYIPTSVASGSTLPATFPHRGDVVLVTDVVWSPYKGINEFALTATSTITTLGQSPLPAPVPLTAAQLSSSSGLGQYEGMRVVDVENFTVKDDCNPSYTSAGGG